MHAFLEFCREHFERLVLYTAVRGAVGETILRTLVAENAVPEWLLDVPFVGWDGHLKDLGNIPDAQPCDCLLIDDNRGNRSGGPPVGSHLFPFFTDALRA